MKSKVPLICVGVAWVSSGGFRCSEGNEQLPVLFYAARDVLLAEKILISFLFLSYTAHCDCVFYQ